MASILAWLVGSRIGRGVLIALAVGAALLGFRFKSVSDGVAKERRAQLERNRRVEERADAAQKRALASDDPRADLLRRHGGADK